MFILNGRVVARRFAPDFQLVKSTDPYDDITQADIIMFKETYIQDPDKPNDKTALVKRTFIRERGWFADGERLKHFVPGGTEPRSYYVADSETVSK